MFATLYVKLIGIGLILAALAGAAFYVQHLRSEDAVLTAQVKERDDQIVVLSDKIKIQNDAVDALKKAGDLALAQAAKDLAAAKAAAAQHSGKATVIYKTLPAVPGKTCDDDRSSALNLLNGGAK